MVTSQGTNPSTLTLSVTVSPRQSLVIVITVLNSSPSTPAFAIGSSVNVLVVVSGAAQASQAIQVLPA